MPKTLHDKLAELDPARLARIRAEAGRLQAELLAARSDGNPTPDVKGASNGSDNLS
jgi:hypothetical protein